VFVSSAILYSSTPLLEYFFNDEVVVKEKN